MTDTGAHHDVTPDTTKSNTSPSVTYPTMTTNGAASSGSATNAAQQAKNAIVDNASAAYNSVANSDIAQSTKQTVVNGPVAESVRTGYADTKSDFTGLANSANTRPEQKLATGQQRTTYHSFFYNLLTWKHPRATLITFILTVAFIFSARYLNVLRYVFKAGWVLFGVTALAEIAGKPFSDKGFASQARPKKYYVLPKETLDRVFGECHELLNFFVLEFQRIMFVENIFHTVLAFTMSLSGYFAIKIVPFWGLCLMGTSIAYLAPLIYIKNQELIDGQIANAQNVVSQQALQVKDVAATHTGQYAETAKQYAGGYSAKLQQYVGNARGRAGSPLGTSAPATNTSAGTTVNGVTSKGPISNGPSSHAAAAPAPASHGIASTGPTATNSDYTTVSSSTTSKPVTEYTKADFPVAPKVEPALGNDLLPEIHADHKPLMTT